MPDIRCELIMLDRDTCGLPGEQCPYCSRPHYFCSQCFPEHYKIHQPKSVMPTPPSGYAKLYDLETYPVTLEDGGYDSPFACPNNCSVDQGQRLRELKILHEDSARIAILQCRSCRKRWLRVDVAYKR